MGDVVSVLLSAGAHRGCLQLSEAHISTLHRPCAGLEAVAVLEVQAAFEDREVQYPSDHLPMAAQLKFRRQLDYNGAVKIKES